MEVNDTKLRKINWRIMPTQEEDVQPGSDAGNKKNGFW